MNVVAVFSNNFCYSGVVIEANVIYNNILLGPIN